MKRLFALITLLAFVGLLAGCDQGSTPPPATTNNVPAAPTTNAPAAK